MISPSLSGLGSRQRSHHPKELNSDVNLTLMRTKSATKPYATIIGQQCTIFFTFIFLSVKMFDLQIAFLCLFGLTTLLKVKQQFQYCDVEGNRAARGVRSHCGVLGRVTVYHQLSFHVFSCDQGCHLTVWPMCSFGTNVK